MSRRLRLLLTSFVFLLFSISMAAQAPPSANNDVAAMSPTKDQGKISTPPAPKPRKEFHKLTGDELKAFNKAVLAMMKLDCKPGQTAPAEQVAGEKGVKDNKDLSPIGWKYQASIHGALSAPLRETWNTCEHSSWFFLSWHRMELYFFEKTLQAWSGDDTLRLPYWNFTVADEDLQKKCPPANPNCVGARLPAAFRSDPANNQLYWQYRNKHLNMPPAKVDPALPLCYKVVTTKNAFAQTAFSTNEWDKGPMSFGGGAKMCGTPPKPPCFHPPTRAGGGQIERVPHDMLHGAVGDGSDMSLTNPAGAGLDPIFWPFHANIDRAWSCWQLKHPGSEPKSDLWLDKAEFAFFYAKIVEKGKPPEKMMAKLTGRQVIDTATQLNYTYGNDPCLGFELPGSDEAEWGPDMLAAAIAADSLPTPLSATAESPSVLASEPVTVSINLPSEVQARIQGLVLGRASAGSIILTVDGLAVDRPSGAAYEVYLNLPQGILPKYQSPYYVGELPFFGVGHSHDHGDMDDRHVGPQPARMSFDIAGVVRQLLAHGEWRGNQVSVTFSANTMDPADPKCVPTGGASQDQHARFTSLTVTVN